MTESPAAKPRLGVVMDPLESIHPLKDSTLAMLLAAQKRGWPLLTMDTTDLSLRDGVASAAMREVRVFDDAERWFEVTGTLLGRLSELDIILMRKDPPFDLGYIAATYVLDHAERSGALVVNRPQALRDANEKVFASSFPDCCPPTLVTASMAALRDFLAEQKHAVIKPLDLMAGRSVFEIKAGDLNTNVILEEMTRRGTRMVQAQAFIPAIWSEGDKRILLINGEPVSQVLRRIPAAGDIRANLAAGGRGEPAELSTRDRWICDQLGPVLRERGIVFAGIDVIGDWLTEINVTSPTGIRQLDRFFGIDIASQLLDVLEAKWRSRTKHIGD